MNRLKQKLYARLCSGAMASFRKVHLRLCPEDIRNMKLSLSQFGEDLVIVDHLANLRRPRKGIYIDAGCFDPFRFSNTRILNLMGWSGINIDASEKSIHEFQIHRPDDENICAALSDRVESNEFLTVGEGECNRLVRSALPVPEGMANERRVAVTTQTLKSLFEASRFSREGVDLLSVDCEGNDLAVLRGFDIGQTRPVLICIESLNEEEADRIRAYLGERGYTHICDCGLSMIFRDSFTLPGKK